MRMVLEAVDNLLKVYRYIEPLSSLWASACQRIRAYVKGHDNWAAVRDATIGHDVKGTLFNIPPNCSFGQLLRLKDFKLGAIAPYVYDRFIGV